MSWTEQAESFFWTIRNECLSSEMSDKLLSVMVQGHGITEYILAVRGYATMELNITELRKQRRPLWLSELDMDDYSDFLGGGGDIYTDRLAPVWERSTGSELSEEDLQEITAGGFLLSTASEAAA